MSGALCKGEVDNMAFVRTGLIIVALMLGWSAVRAHPVGVPGPTTAQAAP